jgi:hypothetical protein
MAMLRFPALHVLVLLPTVALAQPKSDAPAGPVFHLRVSGDIECGQDVRNIRAVLDEAAGASSPLIIIEFGGNNLRLDLVRELGTVVRASKVPVSVYLSDPDDKMVGPGQLCVGLLAGSCAAAPGTAFSGVISAPGLAPLAPDKTDWSVVSGELLEGIQKAKGARLPEGLGAAIVSPTRAAWAVFGGDGASVVMERPGAVDAAPILIDVRGTVQLSLDSKTAARLRLVEELPHWSGMIARSQVKTSSRTERALTVGLGMPGQRVQPLLDRIDSDEDQLKTILKLPWPVPKKISPGTYREAAAKAQPKLEDAQAALGELEKLLSDYPELMRRPAPGQTEVGGKPSTFATRWRSMAQTRRDHIARHAATAEKFAKAGE